jgi:hypothetical protein
VSLICNSTVFSASLDQMHFPLTIILAVIPLVVSTTNITQRYVSIPLSKRTKAYRSDGLVDLEVLKRERKHSIACVISPLTSANTL